jgi:hypothetical protein
MRGPRLWSGSPAASAFRSVSSALIMQAIGNSKMLVPSFQTTRNRNQQRQSCPSPHHEGIWGRRHITPFKGQFYGHSIAGIADSNPTESMGVRLLCLLCVAWVVASVKSWSPVQGSPTVCVCDLETSTLRRPKADLGCCATEKCKIITPLLLNLGTGRRWVINFTLQAL